VASLSMLAFTGIEKVIASDSKKANFFIKFPILRRAT
jgi:hypothetical protein